MDPIPDHRQDTNFSTLSMFFSVDSGFLLRVVPVFEAETINRMSWVAVYVDRLFKGTLRGYFQRCGVSGGIVLFCGGPHYFRKRSSETHPSTISLP